MEMFFLEDQKPNCYNGLFNGLDQPITPMWWRECALLTFLFYEMAVFCGTALAALKIVFH